MKQLLLILSIVFSSAVFARLPHVDFSAAVEVTVPVDFDALEEAATANGRTPSELRKLAAIYLASHRVQEAIWTLREAGDEEEALELTRKLQTYLSTMNSGGGGSLGGGGGAKARRVFYPGEISGVFKQHSHSVCGAAEYEQAAYALDELLGLDVVPVTILVVHEEHGLGSLQYFVHAPKAVDTPGPKLREARMRLLDLIFANRDRNSGNWLKRSGGFVVAIDHGNSNPLSRFAQWHFPIDILDDEAVVKRILALDFEAFERRLGNILDKRALDTVWDRIQRAQDEIISRQPFPLRCAWNVARTLRRVRPVSILR